MGKTTSVQLRDLIICDWENKENEPTSMGKLSEKYKIPKATIQSIIEKYRKTGCVENLPGRGRKRAFSVKESRRIMKKIKVNPFLSAPKIAQEVQEEMGKTVSVSTIKKYLHEGGVKGRTARKKPMISNRNRIKRLQFAKTHLKETPNYWKRILWSDETKINLFGNDGPAKVWRKPNEALKSKNIRPTMKHGGGCIMVWGSMSAGGVGNLAFIDTTMNAEGYVNILRDNLSQSAQKTGLRRGFIFQQDCDPKHTSGKAKEYFKKNEVNVLEWPPQSPDLNPIEHVWSHLKVALGPHRSTSKSDMKEKVKKAWDDILPSVTEKLVLSMPKRLEAVIIANGGPTKY